MAKHTSWGEHMLDWQEQWLRQYSQAIDDLVLPREAEPIVENGDTVWVITGLGEKR